MKKDVAQYLEFAFEKLDCLKKSERGEVWRAVSKQNGDLVIIKRMQRTDLPYKTLYKQSQKISFTLPAKIFYCIEDESETVVVEEFIHGENLLTRLEQKNFLSEDEARKILLQMCDGLKELHEQKIIHRDIKPSNLILQGEKIRLIDFDAARIFKPDQKDDTQSFGTKGYASPEQHGFRQTDERTDIYSLGVTIKVLLGENCGRLEEILDKCTEFDPKNRFQSVDELKLALIEIDDDDDELEDYVTFFGDKPARGDGFLSTLLLIVVMFFLVPARSKKFWAILILVVAAIFLFTNMPTLNRDENFSEPVVEHVEEKTLPFADEKISSTDDNAQPTKKIPAQISEFKLPTIVTPQNNYQPSVEAQQPMPQPQIKFQLPAEVQQPTPQPVTPQENFSGIVKTEFFLNDAPFNQFEHVGTPTKISRDEWRQTQARLHIVNDSGRVWNNPTVKFILGQNWGDNAHKVNETKILPALAVGESTDVVIPFNLMTVSDRPNTHAYIQIRLSGDGAESDETYWSTWFDITD